MAKKQCVSQHGLDSKLRTMAALTRSFSMVAVVYDDM